MVKSTTPATYDIYFRPGDKPAALVAGKIRKYIGIKFKKIRLDRRNPELLIVLGGDGTILRAAKTCLTAGRKILGLNLGNVGFLASARREKEFLGAVRKALSGQYRPISRIVADVSVVRKGTIVFRSVALNEAVVESLVGMVTLSVSVGGHQFQFIQGTGLVVATPTGSTAINLSAHGPIIAPDLGCFVVTELLDHTMPTPSIIIRDRDPVEIKVRSFRNQNILKMRKGGKPAEVLLITDGSSYFPLSESDIIEVRKHPKPAVFLEVEDNYFFTSLKERFGYK